MEINGKVYYSEEKSRSVTFTVPNVYNEKKVKIYLCCSETPWSDEQTRVYGALRITRGDTVVPYTPYDGALIYIPGILDVDGFSADTVLRACGEIYDRIYVREGIAVLEKNISYITLDGTEKYTYKDEYSTDSTAAFRLKPYKYSYGKVYSSHFAGLDESSLYTDGADGIYAAEDGIIVRILKSRLENYENAATDDAREMLFGKWISDTASVTLQYVQNYPEIIDITDTAPARDLLALRTTPGTGYLSTVFDTINTVSYGTVPGDIFCTYPCEITDLIEFKIARALGKAV